MKEYGQYCPIARGAEIFAERWTPLVIRNLYLGCRTFGELREGAPGISKTLLGQRLRSLELYGVVYRRPAPRGRGWTYHLTRSGEDLVDVCFALGRWGARWLETGPQHFDAHVVLWSMSRLADREALPKLPFVVRFDVTDDKRLWVVVREHDAEVCLKHPGHDEDVTVTTTSEWLTKWHMGHITLAAARRRGLIKVEGPGRFTRALSELGLSPFADVAPARVE